MNSFINTNKLWLGLLGLAVFIVFLGFLFRPKTLDFKVNAEEAIKLMNDLQTMVNINDIAGKQLIDIRPAELFAQRHPESAINIPVRNLLDDEALELFDRLLDNGQAAVLYGSDELQATAPWLLLQQLGYQNLKLLKGGFTSTNEFQESVIGSTETSVLDISVIQAKPESAIVSGAKPQKKKSESIIPVRKESTSGGGC